MLIIGFSSLIKIASIIPRSILFFNLVIIVMLSIILDKIDLGIMEALLIKDEKPIINILANDFYCMLKMSCAVYMCKFVFVSFYMCMHT